MSFGIRQIGAMNSLEYRCYIENAEGNIISPFHDIPLFHDKANRIYNMIVEVPRFSNAKLEVSHGELMNPILQDTKKGKLRYVKNPFPYHGYLWNYGALPQTWESPLVVDGHTGMKGDNDPVDAIEIGSLSAHTGQVKQVKLIGVLAMLDEGETDWKLVVIDVKDPLADKVNSGDDLKEHFPGLLESSVDWFKVYKVPDGKPENQFAFNGQMKDAQFASEIIDDLHGQWKSLVGGSVPSKGDGYDISIVGRSTISKDDEAKLPERPKQVPVDNPLPEDLSGFHHIKRK